MSEQKWESPHRSGFHAREGRKPALEGAKCYGNAEPSLRGWGGERYRHFKLGSQARAHQEADTEAKTWRGEGESQAVETGGAKAWGWEGPACCRKWRGAGGRRGLRLGWTTEFRPQVEYYLPPGPPWPLRRASPGPGILPLTCFVVLTPPPSGHLTRFSALSASLRADVSFMKAETTCVPLCPQGFVPSRGFISMCQIQNCSWVWWRQDSFSQQAAHEPHESSSPFPGLQGTFWPMLTRHPEGKSAAVCLDRALPLALVGWGQVRAVQAESPLNVVLRPPL